MSELPDVLIVDPVLGRRGPTELAGLLRATVEVADAGAVRATMPCVRSAAFTAHLQRDPRVWDWVVSVRDGAGVAGQMVSRGQARRAVLMDPLVGIPELPGVRDALIADLHAPANPSLEPLAEALAGMTDSDVPDAYFEIVSQARFGADPGWRRWQGLYASCTGPSCRWTRSSSAPRSGGPRNGSGCGRDDPGVVTPWFTHVHCGLASALSSAVGIPVTVQQWDELA